MIIVLWFFGHWLTHLWSTGESKERPCRAHGANVICCTYMYEAPRSRGPYNFILSIELMLNWSKCFCELNLHVTLNRCIYFYNLNVQFCLMLTVSRTIRFRKYIFTQFQMYCPCKYIFILNKYEKIMLVLLILWPFMCLFSRYSKAGGRGGEGGETPEGYLHQIPSICLWWFVHYVFFFWNEGRGGGM